MHNIIPSTLRRVSCYLKNKTEMGRYKQWQGETHIYDILTKLGMTNRTEAALWAVRQGIVSKDDNTR